MGFIFSIMASTFLRHVRFFVYTEYTTLLLPMKCNDMIEDIISWLLTNP